MPTAQGHGGQRAGAGRKAGTSIAADRTAEIPSGDFSETETSGRRAEDFVAWCASSLKQSVSKWANQPLELEDWQQAFMREALDEDAAGVPKWSRVALVVPRKNGKTMLLAAYACYRFIHDETAPEILLAAASDKQAGRLFEACVRFLKRNPALRARCVFREHIGEISRTDGLGKIIRMASSAAKVDGYNPSLVVCDELHAWTTPTLVRTWESLTTGDAARDEAQVFTITTAGAAHERDESILGHMIDGNERDGDVEKPHAGLTISRNPASGMLVYNYSAPTLNRMDTAAFKLANPASWVTEEHLAKKAVDSALGDSAYFQLHGCVWSDAADAWIKAETWRGLARPDSTVGPEVCVGADGSTVHDTTAIAWASMADDGIIDVDVRIFATRREAPAHEYHEGRIDYERVEAFIIDGLNRDFLIREVAYDPRYMGRSATIIEAAIGAAVVPVEPMTSTMRDALATFYRLAIEGGMRHNGNKEFMAHVVAVRASMDEKGWKIEKRKHTKPIDAVIAAALAVWRASQEQAFPTVEFW
jgi:phage terminase large subunit-like protein